MQTSLKLTDARHVVVGAAVSHCDVGAAVSHCDVGAAVSHCDVGAAVSHCDVGAAVSHCDVGAAVSHCDVGAAVSHCDVGAAVSHCDVGAAASHCDVGAAVSHCSTKMFFYPIYNFLSRVYCLLNDKFLETITYIRICYLFHLPDQNFEAFISRNVPRNIKNIVPNFLFGNRS